MHSRDWVYVEIYCSLWVMGSLVHTECTPRVDWVRKTSGFTPSCPIIRRDNPGHRPHVRGGHMAKRTTEKTHRLNIIPTAVETLSIEVIEQILATRNPAKQFAALMGAGVITGGGPRATKDQKNDAREMARDELKKELAAKKAALKEKEMKMDKMTTYEKAMAEGFSAEDLKGSSGKPLAGGALKARVAKLRRKAEEAAAEVTEEVTEEDDVEPKVELETETILRYTLRAWAASLGKLREAFPEMNIGWDAAAKVAMDSCVRVAQGCKTLEQEQECELLVVASIEEQQERMVALCEAMEERNKKVTEGKKDLDKVIKEQNTKAAEGDDMKDKGDNVEMKTEEETTVDNEENIADSVEAVEVAEETKNVEMDDVTEEETKMKKDESNTAVVSMKALEGSMDEYLRGNTDKILAAQMRSDSSLPEGVKGKDFLKLIGGIQNPEFRDELLKGLSAELGSGAQKALKAMREGRGGSLPQAQVRKVKRWDRETLERIWRLALDRATARVIEQLKVEAAKKVPKEEAVKTDETKTVEPNVETEAVAEEEANVEVEMDSAEENMEPEELHDRECAAEERIKEMEMEKNAEKKKGLREKLAGAWDWAVSKVSAAVDFPTERKKALKKRQAAWKVLLKEDRVALKATLKQMKKDRKGRETGFDPVSASALALADLMGRAANGGWTFENFNHLQSVQLCLLCSSFYDREAGALALEEKLKEQKVVREGQKGGYLLNPENENYVEIVERLFWELREGERHYQIYTQKLPGKIRAKGEVWLWTIVEMAEIAGFVAASPFVGVAMALWNVAKAPISGLRAPKGEKKAAMKAALKDAWEWAAGGVLVSTFAVVDTAKAAWNNKVESAGTIVGAAVGAVTSGLSGGVVGSIVGGVVGNLVREAWAGLKSWWKGRKAKAEAVKSNEAELKTEVAAAPAAAC